MLIRIKKLFILMLVSMPTIGHANSEVWLPTGESGQWGPVTPLPAPYQNTLAKIRCQQLSSSPTPVWTLFLQPSDLDGAPSSYHYRDESGFSIGEIKGNDGRWIPSAKLPQLKWGPWLADLRGNPPALPDCNIGEVGVRLYQPGKGPIKQRPRFEAARCRPGDPLRQAACAH